MVKSVYLEMRADPIQPGDIILLRRASELGRVSVGLLSDAALASAKPAPGMSWEQRTEIVAQIKGVNRIVAQATLDCLPNLREYQPDILVHGGYWSEGLQTATRQAIIDTLAIWGGELVEIPDTQGLSRPRLSLADNDDLRQSHEEIQQVLRAEIDSLRRALEMQKLSLQLLHCKYARTRNWRPARRALALRKQLALLAQSALFDGKWYVQTYPDVAQSGMAPARHYIQSGAFEGRNPGPDFDSMAYYLATPDIVDQGWPALVHYEAFGKAEGRAIS